MFAALITSLTVAAPLQVHIAQGNVRLEQPGSLQAAVVVTLLLSLSEQAVVFFVFFSFFFLSSLHPLYCRFHWHLHARFQHLLSLLPSITPSGLSCCSLQLDCHVCVTFHSLLNVRFPLSFFFLYLLQTSPRARSCCSPTSTGPAR